MLLVRNKRPKPTLSAGIERTQSCPIPLGLAQRISRIFASETFVPGKPTILPDQEMTDSVMARHP